MGLWSAFLIQKYLADDRALSIYPEKHANVFFRPRLSLKDLNRIYSLSGFQYRCPVLISFVVTSSSPHAKRKMARKVQIKELIDQ